MRSNEDMMEALQEHIRTQEEFNRSLAERWDQQQKYFEERFERMERDRELTESLRESLDMVDAAADLVATVAVVSATAVALL